MFFPKMLEKNQVLYTDLTDNTELSVKNGKKVRPVRETCTEPVEVSVYREVLNPDLEKTMPNPNPGSLGIAVI